MSKSPTGGGSARQAPVALEDCPFAAAADLLGRPWVLLVLRELFYGVDRFDAIQADLGVSRSTLSSRLKTLTSFGLIRSEPLRVEGERSRIRYVLTDSGRDFTTALWAVTEWSERHLFGQRAPARLIHSETDTPISAALCDDDGQAVPSTSLAWIIDPSYRHPAAGAQ